MAEIKTFNFMTLENLTTYHGEMTAWTQAQIANATASGFKTVSISKDTETGISTMHFYTVEAPVGEAQAAYSIELPHDYYTEAEIDAFIETINGNIEAVDKKADAAQATAEAAQGSADAAQGAVDALSAKVGTVADDTTVMAEIAGNAADIADLKAIVNAMTGDEEGSVGSISEAIDNKIEALDLPNTYEAKGSAAEEAGKVQDALDVYIESNNTAVDGKADKATTLAGYGITDGMTAEAIVAAIKVETDRAEAKEAEIAGSVTTVDEKVDGVAGDLADYETANDARVKAIEDDYLKKADKEALEAADEALAGRVSVNETAIALLNNNAETVGSVDYKIAQAVAAIMENPDETMNSINELVTWVNGHAEDALELSNQVEANKGDIATLNGLVGDTAVATQIANAIAEALKVDGADKYALASDLTAAITRIAANEAAIAKLGALAQKDIITEADIDEVLAEKINASAEGNHSHANKTVLDGITAEKVTAWDNAQANAEAKAAELDAALKTELEGKINGVDDKFADYSTTAQMEEAIAEVDGKFANYYNKTEVDAAIDADVLVETNRATEAEGKLEERIVTLEGVTHDVAAIDDDAIRALFAE